MDGGHVLQPALVVLGLVALAACARAPQTVPRMQRTDSLDVASPLAGASASDASSGAPSAGLAASSPNGSMGALARPQPSSSSLATGGAFTCVRQGDGGVSCCGNGWHGELGNGGHEDEGSPVDVEGIDDAVDIAAGVFHACARRRDGSLWCWGENRWGQLGYGSQPGYSAYPNSKVPHEVVGARGAVQVSLGVIHSCALRADGGALCWGRNNVGQAGTGAASEDDAPPTAVVGLGPAAEVRVGWSSSCARLLDGTVRCWGGNASGALGNGTKEDQVRPVPVAGLSHVAGLALGAGHGCALHEDGGVSCWGANGAGQLGNGTTDEQLTPVRVRGLSGVARLFAYENYTCALRREGEVRCWGRGIPALRRPSSDARLWTPTGMPTRVSALALGSGHLCALDDEGTLWCGGDGRHGQLCDGSSPPRSDTFPPPP